MVTEKTPKYIIDLEKNLSNKIDGTKSELVKLIDSLAINTKNRFDEIRSEIELIKDDFSILKFDVESLKISVGKIEGHIGRYEIRAQNIEAILIEDYKPRIADLEKTVYK